MLPRAASAGGGPDWVVAAHRSLFIGDVAEDGRAVARLAIDVEPTQANPGGFGAWEILDTPDLPSATGLAAASSEDDPYDDPLTTPRIAVAFGAPSGDPQGQSSTDAANALTIWSFDPAQPELANLSHWRARTADNSACFTPEILGRPSIALFREQLHIVALSEGVDIFGPSGAPATSFQGLTRGGRLPSARNRRAEVPEKTRSSHATGEYGNTFSDIGVPPGSSETSSPGIVYARSNAAADVPTCTEANAPIETWTTPWKLEGSPIDRPAQLMTEVASQVGSGSPEPHRLILWSAMAEDDDLATAPETIQPHMQGKASD